MTATTTRARPKACRHFGTCGGCDRLDVAYPRQFELKCREVAALLAPWLDGVEVAHEPATIAPQHTRVKLSWPVQPDRAGRPRLGMYARGTHETVAIEECRLQDPILTRMSKRATKVFVASGLEPWDETKETGFLRAFHARLTPNTGELLLGVTTSGGVFEGGSALADALLEAARGLRDTRGHIVRPVGVVRSIKDGGGNALLGTRHIPLRGRDYQSDRSGGLDFRVSFGSFWQNHRDAERVLYGPALAMLGDVEGLHVVDGFGGAGAFGLRLARAGARAVSIVESSAAACHDARHNVKLNGLANCTVVHGDFDKFEGADRTDVLIVDPPRKGLGSAGVTAVAQLAPQSLLYVACSASALARDLPGLQECGYDLAAVHVADLFPHTAHTEILARLEHRSRAS